MKAKMSNIQPTLSCRNCGFDLVDLEAVISAVQREYKYTREELLTDKSIKVWCPVCAVADGRVDNINEIEGSFYWEVR